MANSNEIVPSLSDDAGEKTPVERPVSKSEERRLKAMKAHPVEVKREDLPVELQAAVSTPPEPAPAPRSYARWKVLESQEVFRGASSFLVHREQVMSEQHFDIPGLLKIGVKLERLPD